LRETESPSVKGRLVRVVVAMSGGVDSSTAAALLKEQGHDVIGIGLRLSPTNGQSSEERTCCGLRHMDDARRVAHRLDIPFYVLNYEERFQRAVVDYFCRSYLRGQTPNPCVECNRTVKFGHLLSLAETLGAEFVATGHYARVERNGNAGRCLLRKAADPAVDQSYFLYALSQKQLSRALFPLGEMSKEETRTLARSFGLNVHAKPGSQDICFLEGTDYRAFLAQRFPTSLEPGPITNRNGEVVGTHRGSAGFTVGQRRGTGVAFGVPRYVLSVHAATNTVVVGSREELNVDRFIISGVNWGAVPATSEMFNASVRVRYRQLEQPCTVRPLAEGRAEVRFETPHPAAARGQSAVLYAGDIVLAGGIIENAEDE